MTTGPTDICNIALLELGSEPIADIDDPSDTKALKLKAVFDLVRDATMRAHPWNFAMSQAYLAKNNTAPLIGYATSFRLPNDPFCLRMLKINNDREARFKIFGRNLYTNFDGPLVGEFVCRVTDGSLWDANFAYAFGLNLAQVTAFKIVNSRATEQSMREKYLLFLREARSIDGQEGLPDDPEESEFLNARRGGW